MTSNKRVVVIGGGTGTYVALMGLKRRFRNLTAVVSMADDGGSSGRLRDEFGHLPPGDTRRCLLALAANRKINRVLRELFDYRFDKGFGLNGHSFGNLLLTALAELTGSMEEAIKEAALLLNVKGTVAPVTNDDVRLCAELDDGSIIHGERHIDVRVVKPDHRIAKVFLKPDAHITEAADQAIRNADVVVIGPGDLYTSVIPNLLVEGVPEALRASRGTKIYVCNVMTKRGETDGFSVSDFASEVVRYIGGSDVLDCVLANDAPVKRAIATRYLAEGSEPVRLDEVGSVANGLSLVTRRLLRPGELVRHHPHKLARAIEEISESSSRDEWTWEKSAMERGAEAAVEPAPAERAVEDFLVSRA